MDELIQRIDLIEGKISKLLEVQDLLKKENVELRKRVEKRQLKIGELEQDLERVLKDNRNLKTANTLLGSNDFKRETKLKINSLIREIDLCITQLSK